MRGDRSRLIQQADFALGLTAYGITSVVVLLGVLFGNYFLPFPRNGPLAPGNVLESFTHYDGLHYKSIATSGYRYDPSLRSEVAFFPVYPLLARGLMSAVGCSVEWALLLVANLCLAAVFVGLHAYTRQRVADEPSTTLVPNVLLAFGAFPTTFFFRMAYSEAVFLAAAIWTLVAMHRRQPILWVALLTGLVTVTRPVGVAFVPVFLWHWWHRSGNWRSFFAHSLYLTPLACWGLLAYMGYQYQAFGDPLAFAKTQQYWKAFPDAPLEEKAWDLLTLEPIWDTFTPSSGRYWADHDWHDHFIFSLFAANPIYFGLTAVVVFLGAAKRWLNGCEILLGVGLLLIPYVTRGYDNSMLSMGRFAAADLPAYLVLGQLLNRVPLLVTTLFATVCGFMLGAYSALFAAGYAVF